MSEHVGGLKAKAATLAKLRQQYHIDLDDMAFPLVHIISTGSI